MSVPQNTAVDLTDAAARQKRDELAAHVDILRRVKAFCRLPEDTHITTDLVARFFGVGIEAVRSVVKDNRAEVEVNGYRVYSRSEFARSSGDLSSLDPRSRQIAVFPLRAVLNVGMLLRDSEVAQEVRTLLLDVHKEHQANGVRIPDITTPEGIAYMAALFHDTAQKNVVMSQRLEVLEPKAAKFDNFLSAEGDYDVNEAAKVIQRADIEIGEMRLWETLRMSRWTYKDHKGRPRAYQTAIEKGWLREKPQGEWEDEEGRVHLRTPQVRVRPLGIDKLIEMLRSAA